MKRLARVFVLDLRSLALLRIGLGLLVLTDLLQRSRDLEAFYTDAGVLPRRVLIDRFLGNRWFLGVHLLSGSTAGQAAIFVIAGLFALALLVGYQTLPAAVVSWFLLISLQTRNPLVLQGSDTILRLLLFWSLFLPLGALCSVDRVLHPTVEPVPNRFFSVGAMALLLQICFIYWFSALLKTGPAWRSDGTAIYYALSLDQLVTPFGKLLWHYAGLLKMLTFATLGLEAAGPMVALLSGGCGWLRCLVVLTFIGFHLVLGLCLTLGLFAPVCAVAWTVFLPGWFWDRLGERLAASSRLRHAAACWRSRPALVRLRNALVARAAASPVAPAQRRSGIQGRRGGQWLAGCLLLYVALWNLRTTDYARYERVFPASLNWIGESLRLDQTWNLFAPYPLTVDGWYVIPGRLRSGAEVDLFRQGGPVTWEKPALVSATFRGYRWQKYLLQLRQSRNTRLRLYYGRYLCRQWNRAHTGGDVLQGFQLYFMREENLPEYQVSPPRKVLLWTHRCFHVPATPPRL